MLARIANRTGFNSKTCSGGTTTISTISRDGPTTYSVRSYVAPASRRGWSRSVGRHESQFAAGCVVASSREVVNIDIDNSQNRNDRASPQNRERLRFLEQSGLTAHAGVQYRERVTFTQRPGHRSLACCVKYNKKTVTVITDEASVGMSRRLLRRLSPMR